MERKTSNHKAEITGNFSAEKDDTSKKNEATVSSSRFPSSSKK